MAGPSIVVRVLGDLSGLAKSVTNAGAKASGAAEKLHGAFSGVLATLNKTGVLGGFGEALDGVDGALDQIAAHGKDIGQVMLGVGGALAGVGIGLQAIGSKDKAAHQQLQAAVEATGRSYDDYETQVESAIKTQEKFGHTANETQDALTTLTQATNDPAKALQLLGTASDLAARKHEDLNTAAGQLGKTYNGSTKLLKEFGIEAGVKATTATKALESATKQAATADQTAAKAKQSLIDLQARLGTSNKATVVSTAGVTAAQDRLAAAQQRLTQLEAVDATKKKLTLSQQFALQNAHQAVTKATVGLTEAQGKYAAAEAAGVSKSKLSVAQQQELRNAQEKVVSTSAAAVAAHKKLTAAQVTAGQAAHTQSNEMDALSGKLKGQASAAADTFMGKLDGMKAKLEDSAAQFGQKYGPAITAAGAAMTGFGAAIEVAKAAQAAYTAVQAASIPVELAMLAPVLLIIAALAALGVAAYVIYRNWNTIWKGMQAAAKAVWDWIKANWPLLLTIILGPIGLAAAQVVKHWSTIKAGAADVIRWFQTTWATVTGYITAPFEAAWRVISAGFDTLVRTVAGLPGRIAQVSVGMFHGMWEAFRSMVNGIIDIWNKLHFTLPKINEGPIHIGGETIGVPRIPHLAQGGLMTSSGIVFAHAGEVISPAPKAGRSGPAVVLQGAVFQQPLDIDLFMKKAAWIAQKERI